MLSSAIVIVSQSGLRKVSDGLRLMIRLSRTGLAGVTPAVGVLACLAAGSIDGARLPIALIVCISFHYFGVLSNDIADLDVDRLTPRRAGSPLVTGEVSIRFAATATLAAAATISGVAFKYGAWSLILASVSLMGLYNVRGKRLRIPLVMDLVQGASWGLFYIYMVALVRVEHKIPNSALVVGLAVTLFFTIMNAAHGGVRDVVQDVQSGRVTTAILLGVKWCDGYVVWTQRFRIAIWIIEALLVGVVCIAASRPWTGLVRAGIDGLGIVVTISLTYSLFRRNREVNELLMVGNAHMLSCLCLAVMTAASHIGAVRGLSMITVPILFFAAIFRIRELRGTEAARIVRRAVLLRW